MNYSEQYKTIEELVDRIKTKSLNFSKNVEYPYMEDLLFVIKELKDIDEFLSDKFLLLS